MIQCYPWKTVRHCVPCFNIKMPYCHVNPLAFSRPSAGGRPTLHSHRPIIGRTPGGHLEVAFIIPMSSRAPYDVPDGRPAPGRPPWDVFPMPEITPDVGEILTAQLKAPDELPMPHRCPIFSRRPAGHPTAASRCPQKTHREDIGSSSGVNCDRSITGTTSTRCNA